MKLVPSWLATCHSASCTNTSSQNTPAPHPRSVAPTLKYFSDTVSTCSDIPSSNNYSYSASSRDFTGSGSLHSNLSLQTLPSIPSLQTLIPSSESQISISYVCITSFKPRHHVHVTSLAISASNLLYAASGNEINVYDLTKDYEHIDEFNGGDTSSGSVKSIIFCGGNVLTAHQNGKIKVWQVTENKRHKLLTALPTVNDRLRRFAQPKNYVTVRRHRKRLWIEHGDAVSGLTAGERLICSVSWDKSLKIWRPSDLRCAESVKAHDDAVNAVAISGDGTVYTGSADKRIRVWAIPSGEKRHSLAATLEKHKSAINALALSEDGSVLFSGACDRSILVWEREDSANHMAVVGALRGHGKAILCLMNVGGLLMSGSADRTVRVWMRRGCEGGFCCLAVLEGHRRPVKALVALPATESSVLRVYSGSLDGEIKAWELCVHFGYKSTCAGNYQ
uniref:Uncharacterized protein n=1 Tax=Kalanchoe fedtschenkoi TaxID=63787 RepID=A0A7N1A9D6_KALFE